MDAQSRANESTALAALATACVMQAAIDHDEGISAADVPNRLVEENMWRAIRHGLDGRLIDLDAGDEVAAPAAVERLLEWTAPARAAMKLDSHMEGLHRALADGNGAQRQWRSHEAGDDMRAVFGLTVDDTRATYAETSARAERQEVAR
jgi:carboxylate-amine ligase